MKKTFATGLVILLPIAITAYIVVWIVNFFTEPFSHFVEQIIVGKEGQQHPLLVIVISRIIILVALSFFILLLGLLTRRFFFKQLMAISHKILARIPVVKTIYHIIAEATKAVLKPGQKAFKETVLIPFPYEKTKSIGLVTGKCPESLRKVLSDNYLSVFVPTAPHPISGYILFAPKEELQEIPTTTEEAFSFLISCGTTLSSDNPKI